MSVFLSLGVTKRRHTSLFKVDLIPLTGSSVSGNFLLYQVKNFPVMERDGSCSLPLTSSFIQVSSRDVFVIKCLKFDIFFLQTDLFSHGHFGEVM